MTWQATVLTLFPEMFPGPLGVSLAGNGLQNGTWALKTLDIRAFAADKHRSVDDTPAGGGPGMVMRVDVLAKAVDAAIALSSASPLLAMTPRGKPLTQARVTELAQGPGITLICGRFEGFDDRLFAARPIEEVSIGDYVLSGGEPAALVLLDACIRLLPGIVGAAQTLAEESFEGGLLEYPHFTRPREFEGRTIPEVLLSGDHARIAAWRKTQAEERTRLWRPDLWERYARSYTDMPPSGKRR
jgi:tRNA (guanine37-N1)-methyltransferase